MQGIVKSAEEKCQAEEKNLSVPKADQFEAIPGHGVEAVVEGTDFYMGGPAMLKRLALTLPAAVRDAADRAAARGQASIYLLTAKARSPRSRLRTPCGRSHAKLFSGSMSKRSKS